MRFRVHWSGVPGREIERILLEQATQARQGLLDHGASEKAVHEARKACKRARATVALVQRGLAACDVQRLDHAFRDAARSIGPVRDADVMRRTLASLAMANGSAVAAPIVEDREARGESAIVALDRARSLVLAQDFGPLDHRELTAGLLASWKKARSTWDDVDVDRSGESFHEWRKAVKRLLYHVQLLVEIDPDVMSGLESQLDVLQEALGDHHDLHVLAETAPPADPAAARTLAQRSDALEERTLALGGWILSAPPRQLRRWLQVCAPG